MLRDMDEKSGMRRVTKLDYEDEFNRIWEERFTDEERQAMIDAIDAKLDQLIAAPDKQWGSIMNTSRCSADFPKQGRYIGWEDLFPGRQAIALSPSSATRKSSELLPALRFHSRSLQ